MSAAPLPRWLTVSLLLAFAFAFAGNHISARIAFDHGVSVLTAVTVRSAVTSLTVLGLVLAGGAGLRLAIAGPTRWRALAVGGLIAVQSFCLYSAVARIPVALALLAFNTFPFMLALVSWLGGGERPTRRTMAAMPVALVGLALALDVTGAIGGAAGIAARWTQIGPGVAFALGASFTFGLALFLTQRWLGAMDGRVRTVTTMGVVAIVAGTAALATGQFAAPVDAPGWLGLALLTLLYGSAFTGMFIVLPRVGAVNNAAVMNVEPIASLALGWAILDQAVAPAQVVGAFVVIAAIVALSTQPRRPTAA